MIKSPRSCSRNSQISFHERSNVQDRGGVIDLDDAIALGPFTVHLAKARLRRDNVDVTLRPQAFRVLRVLVQSPGRLVDFEQMIREAWDGVRVSRHTVAVTVGEIKHVLEEYGSWITCRSKF